MFLLNLLSSPLCEAPFFQSPLLTDYIRAEGVAFIAALFTIPRVPTLLSCIEEKLLYAEEAHEKEGKSMQTRHSL